LSSSEHKVVTSALDVSSEESIQAWAKSLADSGARVDCVINNAGLLVQTTLDTASQESMLESYKVNAVGPILVTQALLQEGVLKPGSLIANVTSKVGSVDDNKSGSGYAYRGSKAALNVMTKSLSIDLAGIPIYALLLHPG